MILCIKIKRHTYKEMILFSKFSELLISSYKLCDAYTTLRLWVSSITECGDMMIFYRRCIIHVWHHGPVVQSCKCPICCCLTNLWCLLLYQSRRMIHKLTIFLGEIQHY